MAKTVEELQVEMEAAKAQLAAFQKENETLRNAGKKAESEAFFGKLRDEGKLPPALFEQAAALDIRLNETDRKDFRALFGALETKVDLSGKHTADKKTAPASGASEADVAAKIRAYQAEHKLSSYTEAAKALYAEKPGLFEEGGKA
jgi:hypothetical protein